MTEREKEKKERERKKIYVSKKRKNKTGGDYHSFITSIKQASDSCFPFFLRFLRGLRNW